MQLFDSEYFLVMQQTTTREDCIPFIMPLNQTKNKINTKYTKLDSDW